MGQIRSHRRDETWSASLWQTFFSTSLGAQIPVIPEKPLATCGCRKFQIGEHLNTCTTHSGTKKVHYWMVDQITDLFHTTHKVKTQQVIKSRGRHCGDIELSGYLANAADPHSQANASFGACSIFSAGRLHSQFIRVLFYVLIGKLTAFLKLQEFRSSVSVIQLVSAIQWRRSVTRNSQSSKTKSAEFVPN